MAPTSRSPYAQGRNHRWRSPSLSAQPAAVYRYEPGASPWGTVAWSLPSSARRVPSKFRLVGLVAAFALFASRAVGSAAADAVCETCS